MSVHDETWDRCKTCKEVIKSWQYEYHEKYCKDYSYGEYLNLKNGYPAKKIKSFDPIELIPEQKTIWRTDQPKPFNNGGWNEDPCDLMFPTSTLTEYWTIDKEIILSLKASTENGIEYAQECLTRHDQELGRTTKKNETWAKTMEKDIEQMKNSLEILKKHEQNLIGL